MAPTEWGHRALNHARLITSATPGRGSATRLEAQAADYIHHHLSTLGIRKLHNQNFTGARSIWFFLSLTLGVAIMGHLAYALFRPAIGSWGAWIISTFLFGFSFFLLWKKFTFRSHPFEEYLPRGPSQNVIAEIPPEHEPVQQVIFLAHLDTHRAVIWFANDFLLSVYGFISPLVLYGTLAAPLFYLLGLLTGLVIFNWLGAAVAALQFVGWFTGVTADLGVYSPGANDNASALGTVLALAERLQKEPLQKTHVTCVFTGCEETGCIGIREFIKEFGPGYKQALWIDFELVGIGERLVYLQKEGVIRRKKISPDVENLLTAVDSPSISPVSWGAVGAFTEMGAVWEYGYKGACLLVLPENSNLLPEWHRVTDTPDKLRKSALQKTHDFTWKLLQELDQS